MKVSYFLYKTYLKNKYEKKKNVNRTLLLIFTVKILIFCLFEKTNLYLYLSK